MLVPAAPPAAALSPELGQWLDAIDRAVQADGEDYPPDVRHRLFYVFRAESLPGRPDRLAIELRSAQLRKDGAISKSAGFNLHGWRTQEPRYLRPVDRTILDSLSRDAWDDKLVPTILATGRAHWGELQGTALAEGPARPGRLDWLSRKQRFDDIAHHDVVVTTYKLLPRDAEVLTAQEWHVLVLDEAQAIKIPAAETTRIAGR